MKKKEKKPSVTKSGLVKGAFIATIGIVLTKILGIIYVIPFHAVIGDRGGALYGYDNLFMNWLWLFLFQDE